MSELNWVRVEDGLPELDERVLVYGYSFFMHSPVCVASRSTLYGGEHWVNLFSMPLDQAAERGITHWAHIPVPDGAEAHSVVR